MSSSEHLASVMVEEFIRAVEQGVDLVPVVADSTSTAKIKPFVEKFPDRLVNVGIAEQVMIGTAAGLALGGKVAVTCNAAPFLISRGNEQVKVDICYNNTNVKCFGLNAGASYGPLASTHHSIDDISVMRGFGNIEIYAPGTPEQCRQIIRYALEKIGPVYIRLDGKALPESMPENYRFLPGAIDVLAEGKQVVLVAMGSTLHEIVDAAARLKEEGISVGVIGVASIRPCDTSALARELAKYKSVITVEEHNVNGGLGSLVAEVMAENGLAARLQRLGFKDGEYAIAADRTSMRKHHGLDSESICSDVRQLLNRKVEATA
ncbi:transketolase family protein [Marinomonas foliarum]|jgi:transketolase|uniref:Transketolase family protein n=1 Tax=Marinomonas foliarum TaxID=491950 RepID=A0ABX7IR84_9GAMM|nr:transketolase C-terminal domain-containing protein [Marinomonas foliarum]QRV23462.1 transketolase family protein [Marinomonas foliarum]